MISMAVNLTSESWHLLWAVRRHGVTGSFFICLYSCTYRLYSRLVIRFYISTINIGIQFVDVIDKYFIVCVQIISIQVNM